MLIAMDGLGTLLNAHDHHSVQYGSLFLVASGCYSAMPLLVCWFSMNLGGHRRRCVGQHGKLDLETVRRPFTGRGHANLCSRWDHFHLLLPH